jgi:hypothetical protein
MMQTNRYFLNLLDQDHVWINYARAHYHFEISSPLDRSTSHLWKYQPQEETRLLVEGPGIMKGRFLQMVKRERGKREEGRGKREEERGTRDEGQGTRDEG